MLQPPAKDLLVYLRQHPEVRTRIRAAPNKTFLYAGTFIRPMWQEIAAQRRRDPQYADKQMLQDVLATIATPGAAHANLLGWAKAIDDVEPWRENGFLVWRALSGIFAANAVGAVSFGVGAGITSADKVFAATEIGVLARNPKVDALTRDILAYCQRCLQSGQADLNFGFVAG